MHFNREDFRTLSDAVTQYADNSIKLTHQQVEQVCRKVFIHLTERIDNYDEVDEQCLISTVLREYCISHYSLDGVRSIIGTVVLYNYLKDCACVLIFFRQHTLCKYLKKYKPIHEKEKTLSILTRRYGKIQITVDQVTQTLTSFQLYRLCCSSGKERTYPFFIVE